MCQSAEEVSLLGLCCNFTAREKGCVNLPHLVNYNKMVGREAKERAGEKIEEEKINTDNFMKYSQPWLRDATI